MLIDEKRWDEFLSQYPNAHILQTSLWGQLKGSTGWLPVRLVHEGVGVQILFRPVAMGYHIAYIPRGPVGGDLEVLMPEIDALCRAKHTVFLKVEPDRWEDNSPEAKLPIGWLRSHHTVQPPRTLVIDMRADEDELLGRMNQKTRYNVRLARRKGVHAGPSGDIEAFSQLMRVTGERDGFGVHAEDYYRKVYDIFHPHGECELFIAEYEHEPIAGIMAFAHGNRAWYFYGASDNRHRNRMPNYLLQWEVMRWVRKVGCEEYDLWGVPDEELDVLEAQFMDRSDGLWGVYRFKRGFGGELKRTAGPWDKPYYPMLYRLYRWYIQQRGSS